MTTSYNGWEASRDPKVIGVNAAWEPIPGHRFPGGIKAGPVETVMTYVARQLHARVEPVDAGGKDDWGYVYKQSANSKALLSCHSSATAFDWNATRHPNGKRGTWTKAQVSEIDRILAEVDNVVRCLKDATGTPDEMHFEVSGTEAQVAAVAARLANHKEDDLTPDENQTLREIHRDVVSIRAETDKLWTGKTITAIAEAVVKILPTAHGGSGLTAEDVADELAERLKG